MVSCREYHSVGTQQSGSGAMWNDPTCTALTQSTILSGSSTLCPFDQNACLQPLSPEQRRKNAWPNGEVFPGLTTVSRPQTFAGRQTQLPDTASPGTRLVCRKLPVETGNTLREQLKSTVKEAYRQSVWQTLDDSEGLAWDWTPRSTAIELELLKSDDLNLTVEKVDWLPDQSWQARITEALFSPNSADVHSSIAWFTGPPVHIMKNATEAGFLAFEKEQEWIRGQQVDNTLDPFYPDAGSSGGDDKMLAAVVQDCEGTRNEDI
ncbi:hypothetical protein P154DRAFT_574496 [Amniculicola lignicola CBS 123094]|uniref:Uncharacterized protein n=1 Tax=Amniculicola lignicola CBS 123094 TaxID=1392246 RepID=A0A6A5WJV7_9PLEO|nr:hypothetical protein P154DRAFT_574496 [Amniculicola lignicola CBS 123094]